MHIFRKIFYNFITESLTIELIKINLTRMKNFILFLLLTIPLVAQSQQTNSVSSEDKTAIIVTEQGQATNRPKQSSQIIYITLESGVLTINLSLDEGICDILIRTDSEVESYVFDSKESFVTYIGDANEIHIEIQTERNNIYIINL